MKFTSSKTALLKAIMIAQDIISSRNTLSILSNVLLETANNLLMIKATDLSVSFETQIPVDTVEAGSTTIYCDKLLGILRSLPDGEIEIDQLESQVVIRPLFQKIDFHLRSISAEKYPEMKICDEQLYFTVSSRDLIAMIDQTIFSVSDDTTRYFLNGVYLENGGNGLVMVATDGRRLSYMNRIIEEELPSFKPVIIPPKFLNLIKKLCAQDTQLELAIHDNFIFARFDTHKISSTLIDGKFPNYRRVVPEKQHFQCIIDREMFLEALKRVSLLVEQKSKRLFIEISNEHVRLSSEESEIGKAEEEIPCEYYGEPITLAINYNYALNPLKVIHGERVSISFTEPNRAITLGPFPEKDYFHIIMPMQLD
jgi:DNA polymerase III subunit beta